MSILKSFSKKLFSKNQITFNHLFSQKSHIGTTLKKRDPKMDEYLVGFDNSNDTIFNLEVVINMIRRSISFMKLVLSKKQNILIVGTGFKFKPLTKFLAKSLNQPYVAGRWPKGLLTNWENLSPSIKLYNLYLKKLTLSNKQKINLETCFSGLQSQIFSQPNHKSVETITEIVEKYNRNYSHHFFAMKLLIILDSRFKGSFRLYRL